MDELLATFGSAFGEKLISFLENSADITEKGLDKALSEFVNSDINESIFASMGIEDDKQQEIILKIIDLLGKNKKSYESCPGVSTELYS